jgi:solute carrier family 35 (UDP-sugar transporter), member A1/2/3
MAVKFSNLMIGLLLCTVTCLYSIIIKLSKRDGHFLFEIQTTILLSEMFKFFYSIVQVQLYGARATGSQHRLAEKETLAAAMSTWFAVPALIYAVSNTLVWHANKYLSPPQYQLLSNIKMPMTVFLHRLVFKRTRHQMQWLGIGMLILGSISDELLACGDSSDKGIDNHTVQEEMTGLSIMLVISALSAVAGIFSEYKLKEFKSVSIHFSNMQLYFFGILVNGTLLFAKRGFGILHPAKFFAGYNGHTISAVVVHACMGILVSYIMKYADNIMKLFAGACASGLSSVVNYILFGSPPSDALLYGTTIVLIGLFLYTRPEFNKTSAKKNIISNQRDKVIV